MEVHHKVFGMKQVSKSHMLTVAMIIDNWGRPASYAETGASHDFYYTVYLLASAGF